MNQLPIYSPAAPGVLPTVVSKSSKVNEDLIFNEERTHRLVSQIFGRIVAISFYAISIILSIQSLLTIFQDGIKAVFFSAGFCFFWYFFNFAYYELDYLAGNPENKKFYPILIGTGIVSTTYLIFSDCYLYEILAFLSICFFINGCIYVMFMGNDFGKSWFLFCKPWRYRKLKTPISQY